MTYLRTEETMMTGDQTTHPSASWHAGFYLDRALGRLARTACVVAIAIAIVSLASTIQSEAQELRVPVDYQEPCRPLTQNVSAQCLGYALGIYDAMQAAQTSGERLFGLRACAPPGMMDEQARDVMIRFAITHPESRRYSAARQIAEAFSDAFPCPPVVADDVSRRFRVRPAADPDERLP
jgi:hypothetical protein